MVARGPSWGCGGIRILKTREPAARPPRASIRTCVLSSRRLPARTWSCKLPRVAAPRAWCSTDIVPVTGIWRSASRAAASSALRLLDWDFYFIISGCENLETSPIGRSHTALRARLPHRHRQARVRGVLAVWIAGDVTLSFNPRYVLAEVSARRQRHRLRADVGCAPCARSAGQRGRPVLRRRGAVKIGLPWPLPDIKDPPAGATRARCPPPVTPNGGSSADSARPSWSSPTSRCRLEQSRYHHVQQHGAPAGRSGAA